MHRRLCQILAGIAVVEIAAGVLPGRWSKDVE